MHAKATHGRHPPVLDEEGPLDHVQQIIETGTGTRKKNRTDYRKIYRNKPGARRRPVRFSTPKAIRSPLPASMPTITDLPVSRPVWRLPAAHVGGTGVAAIAERVGATPSALIHRFAARTASSRPSWRRPTGAPWSGCPSPGRRAHPRPGFRLALSTYRVRRSGEGVSGRG